VSLDGCCTCQLQNGSVCVRACVCVCVRHCRGVIERRASRGHARRHEGACGARMASPLMLGQHRRQHDEHHGGSAGQSEPLCHACGQAQGRGQRGHAQGCCGYRRQPQGGVPGAATHTHTSQGVCAGARAPVRGGTMIPRSVWELGRVEAPG